MIPMKIAIIVGKMDSGGKKNLIKGKMSVGYCCNRDL